MHQRALLCTHGKPYPRERKVNGRLDLADAASQRALAYGAIGGQLSDSGTFGGIALSNHFHVVLGRDYLKGAPAEVVTGFRALKSRFNRIWRILKWTEGEYPLSIRRRDSPNLNKCPTPARTKLLMRASEGFRRDDASAFWKPDLLSACVRLDYSVSLSATFSGDFGVRSS